MFEKNNFTSRRFHPLKVLFFIAVFIAIATALSWLVMYLWNTILVDVAGVKPLNFWKAAGLLVLSKILFGGFGRRKMPWRNSRGSHWRNKWMGMSEEERREAKSRWKEHCKSRDVKEKEG